MTLVVKVLIRVFSFLTGGGAVSTGFGADDAHVAAAIQNEAEFLRIQRRFDDAEPLYKEAMDRLEAVLGRNSAPWAAAAHNAAALYTAKQDFETAKELYEAALKVAKE